MLRTNGKIQLYPLVRIAAMLILGIVAGGSPVNVLSPGIWLSAVCAGIICAFVLRRYCVVQGIFIMLSSIAFGGYLITDAGKSLTVLLPEGETEYEAVLVSEPVSRGKVVQMDIIIIGEGGGMKLRASLLRDTVEHRYESLHLGDGIRACSLLKKPASSGNSTFDYARWLQIHGYRAQTFIYCLDWEKAEVDLRPLPLAERTKLAAMKVRGKLMNRFAELGLSGKEYAVVSAMTLGDKSLIDKELKNDYSISGASHVLALSGLHLGIVYTVLSFLFVRFRRYWMPQLFILTTIWAYVFLAGMSPSMLRSAIMLTVYSCVGLLGRDNMSVNTLAFAAIVMLAANPLNLYDIGFQLSFMAVLAILTVGPLLYAFLPAGLLLRHCWLRWIAGLTVVSLSAQIGTAPLVAYHFGHLPVYFLLTNFIVIPCATFIIYASIAFFLMFEIPYLQTLIIKVIAWLSGSMNTALERIAELPGACAGGLNLSAIQVAMLYVMICCACIILSYFRRDTIRNETY